MTSTNTGFTKIKNDTNISSANIGSANISSLNVTSLQSTLLSQELSGNGNGIQTKTVQVTGYAPTSFSTLAANATVFLTNTYPTTAATASTDSRLLILPTGARITKVEITNNGTVVAGGTTFDIGTEIWTAAPTGTSNIFSGLVTANLNTGAEIGGVTLSAFGSAGQAVTSLPLLSQGTGITVQALGANNTTGSLSALITYMI
jgi:hypothetical protein